MSINTKLRLLLMIAAHQNCRHHHDALSLCSLTHTAATEIIEVHSIANCSSLARNASIMQ